MTKTNFWRRTKMYFWCVCIWKIFWVFANQTLFKSIFDSLISRLATSDVHNIKYGLLQMVRAVPLQIGEMCNTKQWYWPVFCDNYDVKCYLRCFPTKNKLAKGGLLVSKICSQYFVQTPNSKFPKKKKKKQSRQQSSRLTTLGLF